MNEKANTITIDGKEYAVDSLSQAAKEQLVNLRFADQEIVYLQNKLAMAQTARTAYASVLKKNLPENS